ncbi:SIMPL domain-containing protein [Hyphobacterium sp.]|uniref:SIMPL domain-containing protein n=1 Tax=Hyphobacterium sp. TaxID=2004662 RepID=UPI003749E4F7
MWRSILLIGITGMMAGCEMAQQDDAELPRDRYIEARGRAIVEFVPNQASFEISYEGRADSSETASGLATIRANIATDAIRQIGGDAVFISSDLSVQPYYEQISVQTGEFTQTLRQNRHPDALLGYIATVTLSVETNDLELAPQIRGAAQAAGPSSGSRIDYHLQPTADHHRQAFAAAMEDAAERAQIVARASDSTLDGIVSLREGNQPCVGDLTGTGLAQDFSEDRIVVTGSRVGRSELDSISPISVISSEQIENEGFSQDLIDAVVAASDDFSMASDPTMQSLTSFVCAIFAVEE